MTKIWNNTKTAILLGAMFGLVLLIGSRFGEGGLIMAFLFGGVMNIVAYFYSDKIALSSTGAEQVDEKTAPDLVHMVERLSRNAGLPMPKVYIAPQEAPNAFATGRNPAHAAVAVTRGALRLLSYDELEGVIGHELSHVKNRDTLISCVAATIAGAIGMLGHMMWYSTIFFGGSNNRDREGTNPLVAIVIMLLAPVAAGLIQMAISRSREFVADNDGAKIAGTPDGLISALRKLESSSKSIPFAGGNPAFNNMYIVSPLTAESFSNLFRTHPSTEERIARLTELRGKI